MLSERSIIVAATDQGWAELPEELVMVHFESGQYYGLNDVGARVWKLIQQPRTLGQLLDAIVTEYDVEPGRGERDLRKFLEELATEGLIAVRDETAP